MKNLLSRFLIAAAIIITMTSLNKFYKDSTLLNQEFVKDGSKTVTQMLDSVEKGLTVAEFKRIQLGV